MSTTSSATSSSHDPYTPRKVLIRDQNQQVSGPAGPAPKRRANSVRRTATIDMTWPDGIGTQMRLSGFARDAVTIDPDDSPEVVASASMIAGIGPNRTIEDITATPTNAELNRLVGCRGGGHLRMALDQVMHAEREAGVPLYLLLDDISGSSLIGGFAWSRWREQWANLVGQPTERPSMEGVCIGFSPGASSMDHVGQSFMDHRIQQVVSLLHPDDPDGWHQLADLPPVSMRRARRIDVWLNDTIIIDSAFQDSAGDPDFGRIAVHEYALRATADPTTMTLLSVEPDPRILPYVECPSAVANARDLVGVPLSQLRAVVLERLSRTNGCTHLNDALRALAEVPVLLNHLRAVTTP